jgi:glycosyltransferase involved in cell wall biosynthesis
VGIKLLVSFIVVALNAGEKINSLINDLRKQDYDHNSIEIIFVDSNSSDNTKGIMHNFANSNHDFLRVCVLDNPKKILPCGWNIALTEAKGDVILRVDAHAHIPTDFISQNVKSMEDGERITGGPRISIIDEKSNWQRTLLIAEKSMFGSGIAKYRHSDSMQYVNTLAHAAYRREVFVCVGGYDERLARTEDNEIHYRMRKSGYNFYFSPNIKSYHHARNSLKNMIKQKYLNGYWIGLTMGVSPKCFSIYHFLPLAFVIGIIITSLLAAFGKPQLAVLMWSAYWILAILMAVISFRRENFNITSLVLPFIFFLLHISYGVGTLVGLLKLPSWRKNNKSCEAVDRIKMVMSK